MFSMCFNWGLWYLFRDNFIELFSRPSRRTPKAFVILLWLLDEISWWILWFELRYLFNELYAIEHLWELGFWEPMLFLGCLLRNQIRSILLLWYGTLLWFGIFWRLSRYISLGVAYSMALGPEVVSVRVTYC